MSDYDVADDEFDIGQIDNIEDDDIVAVDIDNDDEEPVEVRRMAAVKKKKLKLRILKPCVILFVCILSESAG